MKLKGHCNLCTGKQLKLVKNELRDDKVKFKVFCCQNCGHLQLLPRPTMEEDREFYSRNLQDKNRGKAIEYDRLKENNSFDTNRHVALIRKLEKSRKSRIVDIGCGYGFFVSGLYEHGYKNVLGTEISSERRSIASANSPVKIIGFNTDSSSEDIGRFDVVTLFHVLEHMADPIAFAKNLRKLLKPKGMLVCEVPNVQEKLLGVCPAYNDFYWIRAHLNYFSAKTLTSCLKQAGFGDIRIAYQQRYGLVNLCHWLTTGIPQIERPVFEIGPAYGPIEKVYKQGLEKKGASDALIAIAQIK